MSHRHNDGDNDEETMMDLLEIKGCVDWDFGSDEFGVKRRIVEMFLDADIPVRVERLGPPLAQVAVFTARADVWNRSAVMRLSEQLGLDLDVRELL